jgi:hypothetical protein
VVEDMPPEATEPGPPDETESPAIPDKENLEGGSSANAETDAPTPKI